MPTNRLDPERLVPLPIGLKMENPSPALPSALAAYHGAWVGTWGDDLRHVLVVERIEIGGTAQVVYATGESSANYFAGGWKRRVATAAETELHVMLGFGQARYTHDGQDRLIGRYTTHSNSETVGLFTRTDPARLGRPHDADTAPISGERVFLPHTRLQDFETGKPVRLEARLYRPDGVGPFPLAIFSHGSAIGRQLLESYGALAPALWLKERGYAVLAPMRRGRGLSEGIYGEDCHIFDDDGQAIDISPGIDDAVEDLESAIAFGQSLPFVEKGPVLLVGQSRGGFLSVIYAGRRPEAVSGIVNFVGGWMGGGSANEILNTPHFASAGRGAGDRVPQLWLYGEKDSHYDEAHVRANHAAFEAEGGAAKFEFYRDLPGNGHYIASLPNLWRGKADEFLAALRR